MRCSSPSSILLWLSFVFGSCDDLRTSALSQLKSRIGNARQIWDAAWHRRCAMRKLYIVRLTKQERLELQSVVKKLKGTGQKVRRAQILLKADADGPNWTDDRIAEAYSCRTRTVERLRQRFVEQGFDETLNRVERKQPPVEKLLTGDQEARIIATRLGKPPQ